ncbi:hypothetical protein [Leucobacter sp. L43]|uniref:hypothetical protein n=1 Tax=Leucobacter sp. L43 TaxID=2798040 RepID=UPI001905658F|nr:hypothetical protein [Leucobacter sp. L43]
MALWLGIGYVVVTVIGIGHTCFNGFVLGMHMPDGVEKKSEYDVPAYTATLPFHPLYNIVVWPFIAWGYFHAAQPSSMWTAAIGVGIVWTTVIILVDIPGWILIKHPWSLTWREFYVDYQPWITLVYLAILVSPVITASVMTIAA